MVIIGSMRSGTTTLFRMTSSHPSVCSARFKEPEFFAKHQTYSPGVDNYENIFDVYKVSIRNRSARSY